MQPTPGAPDDTIEADRARKRRELRRMQRIATALFGLAAVVFAATYRLPGFGWGLVRAVAEASMVGALADWFAVTALFRHPLGLPIPHTAIIPKSKERIGRSLGRFVQQHFLKADYIHEEIRKVDVAGRVGRWLLDPANTTRILDRITEMLPAVARRLEDERIQSFVHQQVAHRIKAADAVALVQQGAGQLLTEENANRAVSAVLHHLSTYVEQNRALIVALIESQVPLVFSLFRLPEGVVARIQQVLVQMVQQPDHPLRTRLAASLQERVHHEIHSDEGRQRIERIAARLADHEDTRAAVGVLLRRLTNALLDDLAAPDSQIRARLEVFATDLGREILRDEGFQQAINEAAVDAATELVRNHGVRFAEFIERKVAAWPDEDVTSNIELNIGKDLQYIRINGTLVGGLVGGLIYLIAHLLA